MVSAARPARLPVPEPEAQAHSLALVEHIAAAIEAAGGFLPFHRYMEMALYAPGLGYYSAGAHKLGAGGDFTTAPELSPLFSRCLARQAREILAALGGGAVLEFGAGSGAMAEAVLDELARLDALPERYLILEVSPDLRRRQRTRLARFGDRVAWIDAPPPAFHGVVLANEVLDAMPVHRLEVTETGVFEQGVRWQGERFAWDRRPLAHPTLAARAERIARLAEGVTPYRTEVNLAAEGWVADLGRWLARGAALLIDYGFPEHEFYHPQRHQGTLMCHYRHHAHDDPFVYPGLQDLTAHVDFSAIARAARGAGLEVAGYTAQAFFLLGLGLEEMLREAQEDQRTYLALAQQVKRLTLPSEMGELFKVMALARGLDLSLSGFALNDRRASL